MRLIDGDRLFAEIKERHAVFADCEYIGDKARRDELSAFMADIVNAPTIGGWISVKDRLPERPPDVCGLLVRRQWYLVALETGTVLTLSYEFDEDRWQSVGSPVTHWMPLPEPPEEVSEDA